MEREESSDSLEDEYQQLIKEVESMCESLSKIYLVIINQGNQQQVQVISDLVEQAIISQSQSRVLALQSEYN